VKEEVDRLLDFKQEYKKLTGVEYVPDAPSPSSGAVKCTMGREDMGRDARPSSET
jgi:hypothetical protein